jgi:hypothetical protein
MPIIVGDRVLETSTTSGTGTLTLLGAATGSQSFAVGVGVGNDTYYTIFDPTANTWEVGFGRLLTGTTLSRTTVFSNSAGTTALISFAANSKNVFCTSPASKYVDQSDVGTNPNQIPLNQYLGDLAYMDVVNTISGNPYYDTAVGDVEPTLLLDFVNSKNIDPRITFTRSTTATYYDSYTSAVSEQNLVTFSEQFENFNWINTAASAANVAATANTQTAPNGTTTADTIVGAATSSIKFFGKGYIVAPTTWNADTAGVFSIYLKYSNSQYFNITATAAETSSRYACIIADVQNGLITQAIASQQLANGFDYGVQNAGSGWYRFWIKFQPQFTATAFQIQIGFVTSAAGNTLDGNGRTNIATPAGVEVYVWGAQLEQRGAVSAYTPTTTSTVTNFIPVLQTAAVNQARLDYNPVTRAPNGLVIEEQRTNLALYSEQFDNAFWIKTNSATVTPNVLVAPDGTLTADKLVSANNTNTFAVYNFGMAVLNASTYTISCYAKAGEITWLSMLLYNGTGGVHPTAYYDLSNGTLGSFAGPSANPTITAVGNGWYRCTLSGTVQAVAGGGAIYLSAGNGLQTIVGNGYSGAYIWGAQLEAGAFATSYIPTGSILNTRTADVATMTGANFSSWYNPAEGTLYYETAMQSSSFGGALYVNEGTANNIIGMQLDSRTQFQANIVTNGSPQAAWFFASGQVANTFYKRALAYKTNDAATAFNFGTVLTDTSVVLPTVNTLRLGTATTTIDLGGVYKKIAYYPVRLSDAELQEMTA